MNEFIPWEKRFETGIPEIDDQHKQLLNMVNLISIAINKKQGTKASGYLLQQMMEYSVYHFKTEESILKKAEYPDLDLHGDIHADFIGQLNKIIDKHNKGNALVDHDILQFLKSWWVDHILMEDRIYIPFLEGKI